MALASPVSTQGDSCSITDRRIQIQFAADGQWLAADKANAPIRREFQLSPDRPFSG